MTLRGLGPYIHGARLEIKPLTILCGENGSGKSTWIEVLRMLEHAIGTPPIRVENESKGVSWSLPFSMRGQQWSESRWLDACYRCELNSHVLYPEKLENHDVPWVSEIDERFKRDSEKIAAARKVLEESGDAKFGPWGCVGLDITTIGWRKLPIVEIDSALLSEKPASIPEKLIWQGDLPHNLRIRIRCAAPRLSTFDDDDHPRLEGLCDLLELGIYEAEEKEPKYILQLQRRMDKCVDPELGWRDAEPEFVFSCSKSFVLVASLDGAEIIRLATVREPHNGHWQGEFTQSNTVNITDEVVETLITNTLNIIHRIVGEIVTGFFPIGAVRQTINEDATALSELMFPNDAMEHSETGPIEDTQVYKRIRPDLRRVERDAYGPKMERENHVQELFAWWAYNLMRQPSESGLPVGQQIYPFEAFVNFWMNLLTKTRIDWVGIAAVWGSSEGMSIFPNGGLIDIEINWASPNTLFDLRNRFRGAFGKEGGFGDMGNVIRTPLANGRIGWHVMSTGFHQLVPIVVQAGLIHPHEIMAVENPEAHLHPQLQIKVAEFLMHQANAGKVMVIETHSDLIVRRVLRGIRDEQIAPGNIFKQSSVAINFTALEDGPNGIKHARIQPLIIDDNGEIGNWPIGFLDDDLKESRKMFNSIYGTEAEDDNDGK